MIDLMESKNKTQFIRISKVSSQMHILTQTKAKGLEGLIAKSGTKPK